MSQNTYELIALAMRYFFAGMMLLIVLRAGRGALIDSRRAARLRKLSPMAGVVGGGGLGDLAIKYGYNRFQTDVMVYSVAILIVIVQVIQYAGNYIYEKIR